jgi:DNA-binding transcriptional MerR regulator
MPDPSFDFTIPDRPAFKAAEVCEIAKLQPYVLRSWESEFPDLGIARTPGGPRVYRKADVQRVLQIRQLVFHDGLTLAGARRKLDGGSVIPTPARDTAADDALLFQDVLTADAKARLERIKTGLKTLLDLVSRDPAAAIGDFHLESPTPIAATATAGAGSGGTLASKRPTARRKVSEKH